MDNIFVSSNTCLTSIVTSQQLKSPVHSKQILLSSTKTGLIIWQLNLRSFLGGDNIKESEYAVAHSGYGLYQYPFRLDTNESAVVDCISRQVQIKKSACKICISSAFAGGMSTLNWTQTQARRLFLSTFSGRAPTFILIQNQACR